MISRDMVIRPLALPEAYNGEGCWSEWKFYFENIVSVNEWNEAKQLQWLRVRLMRRAQKALRHVTAKSFADVIKVLFHA